MTDTNSTPRRAAKFERNPRLEELLREINPLLKSAEQGMLPPNARPTRPVVFVVGAPRSGTTLMLQWLARSGEFAYPSNLLSRFYAAPYLGARVCRLIGDPLYNYADELCDHSTGERAFTSDIGKTRGMFQPNAFWYFWRQYLPMRQEEPQRLSDAELRSIDAAGFVSGVAALQAAFEKPWAMKGTILQFNLAFLDSLFDQVLFVFTRRELAANAASLLETRIRFYGDARHWFSVRPPGSEKYTAASAPEQVVAQVALTNESIGRELSHLRPERSLEVPYEEFCDAPARFYAMIRGKLGSQGCDMNPAYSGEPRFEATRARNSDRTDPWTSEILDAIRAFEANRDTVLPGRPASHTGQ